MLKFQFAFGLESIRTINGIPNREVSPKVESGYPTPISDMLKLAEVPVKPPINPCIPILTNHQSTRVIITADTTPFRRDSDWLSAVLNLWALLLSEQEEEGMPLLCC